MEQSNPQGKPQGKPQSKPKCKLTGTDGNVFALAGKVTQVLKKENLPDQAKEFSSKLFSCGSYNEALQLMMKYVDAR